jgi:cytochrome c553
VSLVAASAALSCSAPSSGDGTNETAPTGCEPVAGSSNPTSIVEVVDMLNAMPKPVDLPCFVQHLAGPLAVDATQSNLSLQPATGRRSPRIFILLDPLIVSIVPEGAGQYLLEMGERRTETRSLKGEVAFPVTTTLERASPFEHVMFGTQLTSCAFCHGNEAPAPDIAFTQAFVSDAFRPVPANRVGIDELRAQLAACDAEQEPYRCSLLGALFQRENVTVRELPASFGIFQ